MRWGSPPHGLLGYALSSWSASSTRISLGGSSPSTAARVTTHFLMLFWDGSSYMISIMKPSTIVRSPRAPVFWSKSLLGNAAQGVFLKFQLCAVHVQEGLETCLTSAFLAR